MAPLTAREAPTPKANNTLGNLITQIIATSSGWNTITAVKDNKIFLVDNNASSRGSQYVVNVLKQMAKDIYPEQYAGI